ncbi:uncharacterized protein F4807DRAFT_457732 [Annulohypoxylon truncatum]|uniref:uncharacterized protein n=1 Tax=Annulohypoxylon truncatum TaxID=327061 RepID=UPI002007690E|nr:uncharacterized protein F4807DRAFT_457732 [Annulohypoxylon truncatum]KAI1212233.1 hypothetical protein F4807DRAFT_457732 [Annulohypoxylon truncatum]
MTRPQMIRADTIDLQSQESPSAKKHNTPSPSKSASNANANGSLAPHQAETIREVEEDRAGEEGRSPRASWPDGDERTDLQQYAADLANGIANSLNGNKMQSEDALAIAQNGGTTGANSDDGDLDASADDDLDDDMMDKISSSPSIEDGGCSSPPLVWPQRVDSLKPIIPPPDSSYSPVLSETEPYPTPQHSHHQASKASADASNRRHHLLSECTEAADRASHGKYLNDLSLPEPGLDIDNGIDRPAVSGAQSKTYGLSLRQQSRTRAVGPELDAKERQISPYDFLSPYIPYDDPGVDDDDDDDETLLTTDPRFIDIGWGGEYLQDLEDIDFEFVYALHTFVATVEGQANATKGDTMVLLDDSNSYWWLVRVVKDSSIGYLPAEHIETPTERLARLNKHRNIDLSATMLGDQAEKAKNPLKTAMKRRKAKTVAFAAPTYVDYSDIDYSTEEEDGDDEKKTQKQDSQKTQQQQEKQASSQQVTDDVSDDDESAKVEPLKTRGPQKQVKVEPLKIEERGRSSSVTSGEVRRDSSDIFDAKPERVTRNGTVRNTDSFFKDETIETKKISLTPGLLRDDNEARVSSDSKDSSLRQRPSLEKDLVPDKQKDEKKKKEKKPSAIRSFFSRKDRKKSVDEDDDSLGKRSLDATTDTVEKEAEDAHAVDVDSSPEKSVAPLRNPSKLQKNQPRNDPSPTRKSSVTSQIGTDRGPTAPEARINNVSTLPPATLRMVESDQAESQDRPSQKRERSNSKSILSKESKPPKVTKAKARVELDDFDSPDEEEIQPEPTRVPPEPKRQPSEEKQLQPVLPGAFPDSYSTQTSMSELSDQTSKTQRPVTEERLSESPVEVSPVVSSSNPPALMVDTSSQEDRSSPVSSPSPELVDIDDRTHEKQDSVTTSTSATTTSTWNDANLRAFFDSGSDIRDLLVIVYDKNDVAPAGPDHPVVGTLFREQNARLAEITTQLDNMLGDWLARKQRLRGTV